MQAPPFFVDALRMPRKAKAAKPIEIDDDDEYEQPDKDGDDVQDAESIAHVLSQLAGTAGTWATVHRVRDNGKLAHVCRVTDLDGFDLDAFGRTYGAGDYRMAFYASGTKGMVAPAQSFSIDESFGKPAPAALGAVGGAAPRTDDRFDRLFELMLTQQQGAAQQMQTMMVAGQQQMSSIVAALIGAKGTPASELASLLQVTRELSPPATDALTEGVRALPEIAKAVAASEHRPTPEQIGRARRIRARRRLLAQKNAARIMPSASGEGGTGIGSPPGTPGSERIVEPPASAPPPLPTTIEGIQAEVLRLVRESIRSPLLAAHRITERFGLENVELMLNAQPDGALTEQLCGLAPELDPDAIAAVEAMLRFAVFGDEEPDPSNSDALSDEAPLVDAAPMNATMNGRVKLAA